MQAKLEQSYVVDCIIHFLGKTYNLKGFIDTGNQCIEPISGKPVHFLSYKAIHEQLPEHLKEALLLWNEQNPYELSMFSSELKSKIRIVVLSTVQKETSKVLAFRMEQLLIPSMNKQFNEHYIVLTKNDGKFPQNSKIILNVQTL